MNPQMISDYFKARWHTPTITLLMALCVVGLIQPISVMAQMPIGIRTIVSVEGNRLYNAGHAAYAQGQLNQAAELWEQARTVYTGEIGADHIDTLNSMNNLVVIYTALGRYAEALKLAEATYSIRRNKLGVDHSDTLNSMVSLANNYRYLGRYIDALKVDEDILALRRSKLGTEHPDTLASLNNLALSYSKLGRYADALKLEEDTLTLGRKVFGVDHPDTLTYMNNLATDYRHLGLFSKALELNQETLALRRSKLGTDHPDTLYSMANLASSLRDVGRHAESLKLNEDILALRRIKFGSDHPDTLDSMNNLAITYGDLGLFNKALDLDEATLSYRRKKLGTDHPDTLASMNNLATDYRDLGLFTKALKLHEDTLALRRSKLGSDHPDTLISMSNLATSFGDVGRHAETLKLNEDILGLRRMKLGTDHPDTLASMNNLARTYSHLGRYSKALKLNEDILALRFGMLGDDHPDTLASMNNLAISYEMANRRPESLALRRRIIDGIDRMAATLHILTRDERSAATGQYMKYYSLLAQSLTQVSTDHAEALTVTERGKARSLLEELTARQAISNSGISTDAAQRLNELRSSVEYLGGKIAESTSNDIRNSLRTQFDAIRTELDTLQNDLKEKNPRYAALSTVKIVTLEQGKALLPSGGAFVSWMFADNESKEAEGIALALTKSSSLQVLKSKPGKALAAHAETYRWLHALPDEQSFTAAVQETPLAAWRQDGSLYIGSPDKKPDHASSISSPQYMDLRQDAIASHGQWLSDTLLKPLSAHIDDASQWILSPDGILATIPWDTIPFHGKPLGEQKQLTVIQSLSVYQLLKDRATEYTRERIDGKRGSESLLAVGGALYQPDKDNEICGIRSHRAMRAPTARNSFVSATTLENQSQNAYALMRSLDWDNLPCTIDEVDSLHTLMGGKKLLLQNASETNLRQLSQNGDLASFRYLHFAAHGYLNTSFPNLSALVLTKTGTGEHNDGFITAGEWPAFNLKSDLLVMSACETGLGKVVNGEGVQGLPYALYVAGNRDTLLTLWQVSDGGTAVFMKRFWNKVKAGTNHAQALAETKREMQRGEAGNAYTDPYYWAPFVLYGVQE